VAELERAELEQKRNSCIKLIAATSANCSWSLIVNSLELQLVLRCCLCWLACQPPGPPCWLQLLLLLLLLLTISTLAVLPLGCTLLPLLAAFTQ
jgi:hypothetical protein